MSVYSHLEYRPAILERIDKQKSKTPLTMAKLAERAGLQPSYLTHVLKGRAHFNADQIQALAENLRCTEDETAYLILLVEHERSAYPPRREKLKKDIDRVRAKHLKIEEHVSAEKIRPLSDASVGLQLDPVCQLIRVFLNFPKYARDPKILCAKLGIGEPQLNDVLGRLQSAGYIALADDGYKVLVGNTHLPKDSPLCQPHQHLMRYKSIDQMQRLRPDQQTSFSVTFSSTPEDKDRIHRAFLDFVKAAEAIVKDSRREEVYQINFDLFPWAVE